MLLNWLISGRDIHRTVRLRPKPCILTFLTEVLLDGNILERVDCNIFIVLIALVPCLIIYNWNRCQLGNALRHWDLLGCVADLCLLIHLHVLLAGAFEGDVVGFGDGVGVGKLVDFQTKCLFNCRLWRKIGRALLIRIVEVKCRLWKLGDRKDVRAEGVGCVTCARQLFVVLCILLLNNQTLTQQRILIDYIAGLGPFLVFNLAQYDWSPHRLHGFAIIHVWITKVVTSKHILLSDLLRLEAVIAILEVDLNRWIPVRLIAALNFIHLYNLLFKHFATVNIDQLRFAQFFLQTVIVQIWCFDWASLQLYDVRSRHEVVATCQLLLLWNVYNLQGLFSCNTWLNVNVVVIWDAWISRRHNELLVSLSLRNHFPLLANFKWILVSLLILFAYFPSLTFQHFNHLIRRHLLRIKMVILISNLYRIYLWILEIFECFWVSDKFLRPEFLAVPIVFLLIHLFELSPLHFVWVVN